MRRAQFARCLIRNWQVLCYSVVMTVHFFVQIFVRSRLFREGTSSLSVAGQLHGLRRCTQQLDRRSRGENLQVKGTHDVDVRQRLVLQVGNKVI